MESLRDKVVIVTGASSGIGRATAVHFAKYGSKLVITARNEKALDETVELCVGQTKENILKVVADVCEARQRKLIVEKTIEKYGKLDVLVNNAGICLPFSILSLTDDHYERIMNTNLKSIIFLTQLCVPHLIKSQGCIVNVSSVSGVRPYKEETIYCVSKAALDQFTKCLAIELAPQKVRVNSVNPGFVKTNILKANGFVKSDEEDRKEWERVGPHHPLGRNGELDEIAGPIGFLASDQASFITGETLVIDGGLQLV